MRSGMKFGVVALALVLTCAAQGQATQGQAAQSKTAAGQTAPSPAAFEVATIKPAAALDPAKMAAAMQAGQPPKIGPHVEGNRAEYTYMALRDLIALAYNIKPYQVAGPEWLATTRFDIVAKMPDGASKSEAPGMVQTLLKDRFKMVAHPSTEEQPVLALVVAKGGPKLKAATEVPVAIDENAPLKPGEMKMDSLEGPMRVKVSSDGTTVVNMGVKGTFTQKMDFQTKTLHVQSDAVTMVGFADMLTRVTQMGGESNRQVIDMTGLKGYYAVNLDISLAEIMAIARASGMGAPAGSASEPGDAADADSGQSVLESVQALGLKLESRKASVDRLVIDNIVKTPSEN